ncbi:uncharacterized protein cubi_03678 [Cryptosporidium ubiquitum]|uniref:Nucleoporin n=1 Tax=Cryptosporidium ubiquitum TaxID=857276 RepID=A0A1J4MF01_9CRYT|nr:uncharacterized protein cubi_03678 [Cryptosporidium ubiquitum]OII72808.1 hypothetical protein cubi_03678 [Cryptosporidium ubiquitum]
MFDNIIHARNGDFYQIGSGNQINTRGKNTERSSNSTNKGNDLLDPISKSDIIGISLNSCIKQDEEFSELSHFLKGIYSTDYEYRPETFEVKALSGYFPKKIKQAILNNFKSMKLNLRNFDDRKYLINKLSSEPLALKSKTLSYHSIFYIYNENEIIFWNWSKDYPIYSVQTEEFFQENTKKKAIITSVGSFEDEQSSCIKILVSTNYYLILLNIVKNTNGNYVINRVKDSYFSLSGYKDISFTNIISHQASGRFFLGCGNTGTIYEYTMEQESSWIKRKVKKISEIAYNDSQTHSLARLIKISGNQFVSYLPKFIRNYFFNKSQSFIKSMFIDEFRGLIYVLYMNSDIDVFLIPIGNFRIKKISDDLTYIEKGDSSSSISTYLTKYLSSNTLNSNSFFPSYFIFRLNINTIKSELSKLLNSNNGSKKQLSIMQQKKNSSFISCLNIHSIHPTSPQESDSIYAILVTNNGDRIYLESIFEFGNKPYSFSNSQYNNQFSQNLVYSIPINMRVKEFKRTAISSDDSEEKLINSSLYSNGVSILTTLNIGDGIDLPESIFSQKSETNLNRIPENLNDDNETIFSLITSNIFASCIDQTFIAKNLSNRNLGSSNMQNIPTSLNEWQYSFSDPNLGLILSIKERNVPTKYQRLFENLWNTPNPFSNERNPREILFIRPNISASNHDQLLSNSNLSGFGCKTSGSKFFHLWRYFFNRLSSKSIHATETKGEYKPHCLIQNHLRASTSCSVFGINIPQCPPNGLNDLILDQITECRSWTIVTTKGIFILEKKRLLDIITKMTLEPHNYSFMIDVFDEQESFSPINGLSSFGRRRGDMNLQNNKSTTFIMKLLGTFAQTITFEQFFALIWQGLVCMNTKEILDSELIQRFYSSDIKNDSPFEIHIRNKDVGMLDKNLTRNDFPSITLIKIWLTLLSDNNIQSGSNSNCFLSISSFNHILAVTPRFKGLLLLIGRIIRSIWGIPLFQQTDFELINKNTRDFSKYIDEEEYIKSQFNQHNNSNDEFDIRDFSDNNNNSKFVSEFIKSQIESTGKFCNSYQDNFLLFKDLKAPKSFSCKNKNIILEIHSCIHEFFKSEASDWLTHNQVDNSVSSGTIYNNDKIGNKSNGLIPENNTVDFAMNDSISVTISSSLKEDHISHLKNNLIPINNLLNLLLPWWFPNFNVEINRKNDENAIFLANNYSTNSSFNSSSSSNSNTYSSVNISELHLFIETKNFISRTIEILEMMSLFCKTYPFGLKYNAKITNEAILCSSYMDILKKSLNKFTLFELSNNKGLQFVLRLLFRYNILSASQYMSSISSSSKYSLISCQQVAIEHCISSLNKDVILNKRKKNHAEDLLGRKKLVRASKVNTKDNEQLGNLSSSQIMPILFENIYEVPLNIVLSLLYYNKEIPSIITLINSQSEYIHHTGLLPPWLSNGEKVEISIPTSISEFSSHISNSNSFVKYFLSILLFEINQFEPQYNNRLMSFQDIIVNFEESGCKTLLEFCKTSSLTHAVRSIYTYEFHCSLWIYQNLQHTLDITYNEYIIEIGKFLSKIDLVDDPAFDYLKDLDVSFNHLKNSSTPSEQKILENKLIMFKNLRENILKMRFSIIEFILCCLKQESDYKQKFNKQNSKSFSSTCREWLHYYMFSYVSYIDSCMQKTVHEEIINIKGGNRLENWLIKNLSISVFQFSEHSVYLKNWLEHFHLSESHSYSVISNEDKKLNRGFMTNNRFSDGFENKIAGSVKQGYDINSVKKSENDQPSENNGVGLVPNNYKNENSLKNDQGYLLYNAKQYFSAGQYYYTKSKAIWKIPSGVNSMIAQTQGEIYKSASRKNFNSAKLKEVNSDEITKMQDFMRRSLDKYRRRISSSSFIQGGKRLDAIFELLSDIHLQVLKMQQDPTLIQRRSLLLQSQTCIERDMNDDKNKEFIKSIRNDIFNIDTQIEILLQIAEFINYYILTALEQNVNINPLVKQIFDLFGTSVSNSNEILHFNENFEISQEGINIFKSLVMGIYHIQSMVHSNDTLLEFITEFYNLTGFSSITEIKWLMENSKNEPKIIDHIIVKIPSLCEYRTKQSFFFESPILFEVDIADLLLLCENSMPYDLNQNNQSIRNGMNSRISLQQFDSILETITLELYKFSILYYNRFRQSDLVDIYSFEDVTRVKSRVLWWVWPIRFLLFHLNNRSIVSRLLPLFSGNSNNSNLLSNMINNHERMEISEMIKASIV